MKRLIYAFVFIVLIITHQTLFLKPVVSAEVDRAIEITAYVGTSVAGLFGYTSPFARVQLTTTFVAGETTASEKGYFEFGQFFISSKTKELCLTALDREKRATNPVCIPAPDKPIDRILGPVILPPSLSLEKGTFLVKQLVEADGESIPNSEITVSLFRADPTFLNLLTRTDLVKAAYAVSLPIYTIKTDQNGYYSFNLPSITSNIFRLFTQVTFADSPSPKSNTLTFKVLTFLEYLLTQFWFILVLILIGLLVYVIKTNHKQLKAITKYGKTNALLKVN